MKIKNERIRKLIPLLVPFIAAFLLELFVFNFRSWQSLFYDQVNVPAKQIRIDGLKQFDGWIYKIDGENGALYLEDLDALTGGKQVHNVWLDIELPDAIDLHLIESGVLKLTPYLSDSGHANLYSLKERPVRTDIMDSQYIWLSGAGQINTVAFSLKLTNGSLIKVNHIVVNARQPVCFHIIRFLVLLVFGFLVVGFRKKSTLWDVKEPDKEARGGLIAIIGLVFLLPAFFLIFQNDYLTSNVNFQPYHELSRALASGNLYIDRTPPSWLQEMENPYDMSARDALSAETGEEYLWDYAYYNGHYYVYYGVAPCVMFYLPFYLLTGNMLPNTLLIILCSIFLYIGGYFLIRQFAVRIGEVPYAVQIELLFCVFFGSLILYFLNQPDAYAVPVVCGGVFTIWGLFLWLKAEETDKISFLFLGSLCMAIVGGCRPHMLIYGLASIPIFGKKFREMLSEADKRKRGIVSIVAFILPYILVGSGLMLYNASRFGDPFDFGQGYNLTIQDGTNPVFSWDKVWIGIYEYLLKLPRLEYSFPFLSIPGDGTGNNMLGHSVLYMEYVFGGLLSCSPVCLFIFGLKKYGRGAEKKLLWKMAVFLGAGALLVFLADAIMPMAGIVYRYMADFSVVVLLISCIAFMSIWKEVQDKRSIRIIQLALHMCLLTSFLFHINFYWLTGLKYPLIWGNTSLYYKIYYSFMFW